MSLEKMFSEEWKERRRYALLQAAATIFKSNDVESDIEAVDYAIRLLAEIENREKIEMKTYFDQPGNPEPE